MKITKFISLQFNATTTTTARVDVPFKVSRIHVKSIGYEAGTLGKTDYVVLMSNLGDANQPLGVLFQDNTYASTPISDVEIKFFQPEFVQGSYTFTLLNMNGTVATTSNNGAGNDAVGMVVEFNSPEELN